MSARVPGTRSEPRHIDALTGVRAYAALFVLAFHAWLNAGHPELPVGPGGFALDLSPYAKFGWIGVDVFFVLSGFLLTRVALDRGERAMGSDGLAKASGWVNEPYGSYLRRRILRVFPAYYACISVLLVLAAAGIYREVPGTLDMAIHVLMSHNFIERYITSMNGVFWTLPFEWHFYLVFPLLFAFQARVGAIALYLAAVAIVLATKAQVMIANDGFGQTLVLIRLDAFCAGMAASLISARHPLGRSAARLSAFAGVLLLAAVPWVFARQPGVVHYYDVGGFVRPFWMHLGICLVLCALTATRTAFVRLFDHPFVVSLGTISYSIYLWHLPVVELLAFRVLGTASRPPSASGYFVLLAATLAVVLPLSALSYRWVERPFLDARARRRDGAANRRAMNPLLVLLAWGIVLLALTAALNARQP